jgi:hypothetical protein
VDAGNHAQGRQFRLAFAGQDVDLDAADALGLGDEISAVLGIAASRGGDRPRPLHADGAAEAAKTLERRQRRGDRVRRQEAGRLHLASEAGQRFLVEDRCRASGQPLISDHAHRVRADVDDRNGSTVVETPLCAEVFLTSHRHVASVCGARIP